MRGAGGNRVDPPGGMMLAFNYILATRSSEAEKKSSNLIAFVHFDYQLIME